MTIKANEVAQIIELFQASDWQELHLEIAGLHLFLSADPNARLVSAETVTTKAVSSIGQNNAVAAPVAQTPAALLAPTSPAETPAEGGEVPDGWEAIRAPNLGTFYRSPTPGAASYVEVGQDVDVDDDICLIEVMKLFTTLKAGNQGVIRRICVDDGEMVEAGQTLFYIEKV